MLSYLSRLTPTFPRFHEPVLAQLKVNIQQNQLRWYSLSVRRVSLHNSTNAHGCLPHASSKLQNYSKYHASNSKVNLKYKCLLIHGGSITLLSNRFTNYPNLHADLKSITALPGNEVTNNIKLLLQLGMTKDAINKCESKEKGFLKSTSMKWHIDFLESINLSNEDICNIMQRVPRFFMSMPSVVDNIAQYMLDVGVSRKDVKNLLIFSPSLFYRVKGRPQRIGSLLLSIMQENDPQADAISILAHMLRNDVKLFNRSENEVRRNLAFLKELGIDGTNLVKIIRYCPSVLRIGTDFLQERWLFLQKKLELNNQEMISCVKKHPRILTLADDKITDRFAFLYGKAGFLPADVAKNPRLFERSLPHLEKRLNILKEANYQGDFIPMLIIWGRTFDERVAKIKSTEVNED